MHFNTKNILKSNLNFTPNIHKLIKNQHQPCFKKKKKNIKNSVKNLT
jgi:hypothetical protein